MRIIDKLPKTPDLNEKLVRMITGLLFLKDAKIGKENQYEKFDMETVLQIMGNIAFLDNMFNGNRLNVDISRTPKLVISGGINPEYKENTQETVLVKQLYTLNGSDWNDVLTIPEAEIINNRLSEDKFNPFRSQTYLETKSTNIKENISLSRDLGFYDGVKELYLFTTKENTLRAVATARKHLSNIDISSVSYTPAIPAMGVKVDEENWAKHPLSRQYVYGEFLRVVKYTEIQEITLTETEMANLGNIINALRDSER